MEVAVEDLLGVHAVRGYRAPPPRYQLPRTASYARRASRGCDRRDPYGAGGVVSTAVPVSVVELALRVGRRSVGCSKVMLLGSLLGR